MGTRRHHSGACDPAGPGAAAGILVVCPGGGIDRVWIVVYTVLLRKGEGHENLCVSHAALSGAHPAALAGITEADRAYAVSDGRHGAVPADLHLPLMEIKGSPSERQKEQSMEISFEGREAVVYRESAYLSRRTQETAESVVPDTEPDIQKIAAVQSGVFLKSKDLSARGVTVSGEVFANILCIPEGEAGMNGIRVRRPFTLEFEAEGLESETLAQVSLLLQGTDVRMVNPRKISATFDVEGQLCCYRSESLCVDASLPGDAAGLHARTEEYTLALPNAVCEKCIAVNEQFPFPDGQTVPESLLSEKAEFRITDFQLIGSKMIVKGSAEISIIGLSGEDAMPAEQSFSAPFSQIVDVGAETMQYCTVKPEITGAYFDLVDTISGQKALDMELHAVLQLVSFEPRIIRCVADAYSNLMPAQLKRQVQEFVLTEPASIETLSSRERVGLTETCAELLHVFSMLTRLSAEDGKLSAAVTLDFVYRNGEGKLSACRRTLTLSGDTGEREMRILSTGPITVNAVPDGEYAECTVTATLCCAVCGKKSISAVSGVVLNEDGAYVQGSLPTLTLVRREGESLWALAKRYHSSEERIRELNEDAETTTRMLLIPKCI